MFEISEQDGGIVFLVRVQPKATQNQITGIVGTALKVKVTAPPEQGKANKECQKYLAKVFNISKSRISIVSGAKSRNKRVLITGFTPSGFCQVIKPFID